MLKSNCENTFKFQGQRQLLDLGSAVKFVFSGFFTYHQAITESSVSCRWLHLFIFFSGFLTHHQAVAGSPVYGRWRCLFVCNDPAAPASKLGPGLPILDHVICYLWNAQFIYWCFVFISGWFSHHQLSDYSDISLIILYSVFMF